MEEIPSKKQKNPGLALLDATFKKMQQDVAESHTLHDDYLPQLEAAFELGMKTAMEFVVLTLGEKEVIQPQDMPTEEDMKAYLEEVTRHPK